MLLKHMKQIISQMSAKDKSRLKLSEERLICNSCRKKYGCRHYGFAKEFINENPNNDMKCEIYEKE